MKMNENVRASQRLEFVIFHSFLYDADGGDCWVYLARLTP